MKKCSKSILIISCALAGLALAAYAIPTPPEPVPTRILMPNSGGFVVFTHASHAKQEGATCESCHHDLNIPERELNAMQKQDPTLVFACGDCHGAKEKPGFVAEHKQRFAARNDGGASCVACHHTESLPEGGAKLAPAEVAKLEFTGCQSCHEGMMGRMDAFHASCAGCHEKQNKGPGGKACRQCHM